MSEVLIPVPVEHVDEFRTYMLQRIMATKLSPDDVDKITAVRSGLAPMAAAVFSTVRQSSALGRLPTADDVASAVGASVPDVLQLVLDINAELIVRDLPPCLLLESKLSAAAGAAPRVETLIYILPHLARRLESDRPPAP